MEQEDEIFVEIERGKTLVIRCLAIGETDEKGMVTVFFELNGQPRRVKVPDRVPRASAAKARPQAEPGKTTPISAPPMPGVVSAVSVTARQSVQGRRRAPVHRSHENGNRGCTPNATGEIAEVLVKAGEPDRREGSAGGVWVGSGSGRLRPSLQPFGRVPSSERSDRSWTPSLRW